MQPARAPQCGRTPATFQNTGGQAAPAPGPPGTVSEHTRVAPLIPSSPPPVVASPSPLVLALLRAVWRPLPDLTSAWTAQTQVTIRTRRPAFSTPCRFWLSLPLPFPPTWDSGLGAQNSQMEAFPPQSFCNSSSVHPRGSPRARARVE